jgi:transcriptional regulator
LATRSGGYGDRYGVSGFHQAQGPVQILRKPPGSARDVNPAFSQFDGADVRRLITQYPLAWVISPGASAAAASLLPMLGDYSPDDRLTGLVGHMSRGNPLVALFEARPVAHFLFSGPQAYVSPEHSRRRNWGPTWNYASLRIEADVRVSEDLTADAVARLVGACEAGRPQPWTTAELQDRYPHMLSAIIGFEARVTALDGFFKLGQDESDEVLAALASGHPDEDLRAWMQMMNADRLG